MPPPIAAIFVSSTWLDLQPERAAVERALNRFREAKFIGMEYFGSRDETTHRASLDEVDRAQLYVGIFAGRYGSGITEAEYRRARERNLDCLIYFKSETAIAPELRENDPVNARRLIVLKEELRKHIATTFSTPDELGAEVTADVHRWLFDKFLKQRLNEEAIGEIFTSRPAEGDGYRVQIGSPLGNAVYAAPAPATRRRPTPLLPSVRRFRGLIDRSSEVEAVLAALSSALPVEIYGALGVGKTTLLRTLAYHPGVTGNSDGVVYLDRVGQQPIADLLQFLYDTFYESNPRFKPREGELRQLLRDPRALILLDDVELAERELDSLFNVLPNSVFCLATEERRLHGEVKAIALRGLPRDDGLALIERELDKPLTAPDRPAALTLYELAEGYPARLILGAANAREQGKTLAELGADPAAAPASAEFVRRNVASRSADQRRILAALCALGVFISKESLAAIASIPAFEPALQSLLEAKLVQTDGAFYSLSAGVKDAIQATAELSESWATALNHFVAWTEQHRAEPESVLHEVEAIQRVIEWATRAERWTDLLRLIRATEPALSANGRWTAWKNLLEIASRAAREMNDPNAQAWVLHQQGGQAICMGDKTAANTLLNQALELRIERGDHWGASVTRHNLDLLRPPPALDSEPPKDQENKTESDLKNPPSKLASLPGALKFAGLALLAVTTGLVANTLMRQSPVPFKLNFTPARLDFLSPAIDRPSPMHTVSATNGGNQTLTISTVAVAGAGGRDFTLTANDCAGKILPAGANCSIRLVFTPSVASPRNARLIFTGSERQQSVEIELRGGIEQASDSPRLPRLSLQPATVEFGSREVGSRANTEITLSNSGATPLRLSGLVITGAHAQDFAMSERACQESEIAPGSQCTVPLTFIPSGTGPRVAELAVTGLGEVWEQARLRGMGISHPQASITIQPPNLTFGELELRQQATKRVTLTHNGDRAVEVGKISITGAQASDYRITENRCQDITLSEGRRCSLEVSFAPARQGSREATLIITDNSPAKEHNVIMTGFGRTPAVARISIEPDRLDFGAQAVNSTAISGRVVIRNSGTASAAMGQPNITGPDAGYFSLAANSCGDSLASEASCRITVRYVPRSAGNHRAILRIDPRGSVAREVSLSGSGTIAQVPIASFNPPRLNFGEQPLRRPARSQNVTVQNRGTGELVVNSVEIRGSNSFEYANQCGTPLRDNSSSCTIRIGFTPRTSGAHDAQLLISHNAANSPQRILLSGFGAERATPTIGVAPDRIQFGKQIVGTSSTRQAITVTSTGSAVLSIGSIRIEGPNPNDFATSNNCVERPISPGSRCQIFVSFAPKGPLTRAATQASTRNATLVIAHNATGNPARVTLEGAAIAKYSPTGVVEGLKFNRDLRVLATGWCCTNGNLQKGTRTECTEKKGTFFSDQQTAESQCRQVIR
jgi:Domain of unknown function (DUF4062)/NB-ARC domain/Abnormal spindle-like microcephaly-assoc'd, ASPM-SPD-2-Hydin